MAERPHPPPNLVGVAYFLIAIPLSPYGGISLLDRDSHKLYVTLSVTDVDLSVTLVTLNPCTHLSVTFALKSSPADVVTGSTVLQSAG